MHILGGKVLNVFFMNDDHAVIEVIATKNVKYRIKVDHESALLIKKSGAYVRVKNFIPHCYFKDINSMPLAHFILGKTKFKATYNNGDPFDLRKSNLDPLPRPTLGKSEHGIPGVYPNRNNSKWGASVDYKSKTYFLGYFDTEIQAASAVFLKWLALYDENNM